jgi:hypothetical protein
VTQVLLACIAPFIVAAQSRPPVPIPDDLARDAYEIYSALYRTPPRWDRLEPDEFIVIASGAISPDKKGTSVLVRPHSAEERQMLRGLLDLSKIRYTWQARFDFGRQYRILSEPDLAALGDCRFEGFAGHPDDPKCAPFTKVLRGRSFSLPSFNKSRSRALVFVAKWCGFLCGGADYTIMRRTASGWEIEGSIGNILY